MKELLEAPVKFFEGFGANSGILYLVLGLILLYVGIQITDVELNRTFSYIFLTLPIWAPIATFLLFYNYWVQFVQMEYNIGQGRVTLEIKLPQEVFKSPEAMEQIFIQLHQTASPDNLVQTYWDGKNPPTYSLEIVSRGGDLHLYMNVPRKKFKNITEAQLYAQYPNIEVAELPIDYTAEIPWDPEKYGYFSIHFGLKKADAYPIKTYYEYGLHTMPKEEEKVDPISSMLEAHANLGPDEWYWTQIIITANRKVSFEVGSLFAEPDWTDGARKEIKKIVDAAVERAGENMSGGAMQQLTEGERDTIKAIERSIGKNAFNVGIRGMYIGKFPAFQPGERIGQQITSWRSYDDLNRNAIGVRWRTDVNWPWWQDPKGKWTLAQKRREFYEYKARYYESQNAIDKMKVFTTEELATIFHIPGQVAITPRLNRIPSVRSEAPTNLPV